MKRIRARAMTRRRGTVLLMAAVMVPVLLGMAAVSIDMGYIVAVQGQLQNAADAGALAGVAALEQAQLQTVGNAANLTASQNAAIAAARAKVRQFVALNSAGGVGLSIPANLDGDIVVGYQSSPGGSITPTSPPDLNFPNAVKVTVRRDASANTPVTLFFAPAIGGAPWSGTATSAALVQSGANSLKVVPGVNGLFLPIAIDYASWTAFLKTGLSPDGKKHDDYAVVADSTSNPAPNNVSKGADGIPEFFDPSFPGKTGSPGAFGWVDVGQASGGVGTIDSYITGGPTPSDIAYLLSSGQLPLPAGGWASEPGNKQAAVGTLASIIGEPREIMLFSSTQGNGKNATYNMVGFAGVTMVQSSNGITLQPTAVIDPTVVTTSGASGASSSFVYSAAKLTQ